VVYAKNIEQYISAGDPQEECFAADKASPKRIAQPAASLTRYTPFTIIDTAPCILLKKFN
jgi:hypothetical protein